MCHKEGIFVQVHFVMGIFNVALNTNHLTVHKIHLVGILASVIETEMRVKFDMLELPLNVCIWHHLQLFKLHI